MLKPEMSNMPGIGSMTDAFDFMRKMWGGMGTTGATGASLPGMVMPTFSVEEINKQIADLKAVEAWLSVNMNMLRATIQALEVQSATLASLQAMGQNFAASMKPDATSAAGNPSVDGAAHKARKEREADAGSKEEPKNPRKSSPQHKRPAARSPSPDAEGFPASMADPAAWWSMLQNQFNQAVGNAMASEPPEPEPPKANAGRKRKAQPRGNG